MKISDFFIGRPVYWVLVAAVIAVLAVLGLDRQHVRDFVPFQFTVLGLAAICVVAIVFFYKPGERITREPIETEDRDET